MKFKYGQNVEIVNLPFYEGIYGVVVYTLGGNDGTVLDNPTYRVNLGGGEIVYFDEKNLKSVLPPKVTVKVDSGISGHVISLD